MATPPLRFDSKVPASWPSFFRRIKNHIASKGNIADNQRKSIMLDALDDATLDRLERWLEPVTLDAATYALVEDSLKTNMTSSVNSTVQYIHFTARKQQPGESAPAFAEALSVLAAQLGVAERSVRDLLCMHQFVSGVADSTLQDKLLDLKDCNLAKALDMALHFEATRVSAAALRPEPQGVFKVSSRPRGAAGPAPGPAPGNDAAAQPLCCYYCTGQHRATECTADRSRMQCDRCKRKGHVMSLRRVAAAASVRSRRSLASNLHRREVGAGRPAVIVISCPRRRYLRAALRSLVSRCCRSTTTACTAWRPPCLTRTSQVPPSSPSTSRACLTSSSWTTARAGPWLACPPTRSFQAYPLSAPSLRSSLLGNPR